MKNLKQTIRKILSFLNNPDEEGGFWLPNIQRPFVWNEGQICRLFDSILREYPISTLLIWKTNSDIRRRKFIDNWKDGLETKLSLYYVPGDQKKKCLVLDGQQRLQSLFIGLHGSFNGRELYFDILSGQVAAPDDIKYRFRFLEADQAVFPWLKFKDLVRSTQDNWQIADGLETLAGRPFSEDEKRKVSRHLELVSKTFKTEERVSYQELDSIDNPTLYSDDDVVEVFIRANSGGTRLGKSDLLFSLLATSWDLADDSLEELLDDLNTHGFAFDRDFVLKTCLSLLDKGAQYNVQKFRAPGVREDIAANWKKMADAMRAVLDFVRGKTFIQGDKALPSYLALIPLIYLRYHFPGAWLTAKDVDAYLLRVLLVGAFSFTPDQLIDSLTSHIREKQGFDFNEILGVLRTENRSLELTEDRFFAIAYGSSTIHLLFNLWYRGFNHTPAYVNNLPQVDHIFPQSLLRKVKTVNPDTGRKDVMRYREAQRNQLANCMLLTQQENGSGGKWDTPPDQWFADKPPEYLHLHLIPEDPDLWRLERFDDFIVARQELLMKKFRHLLVGASTATTP